MFTSLDLALQRLKLYPHLFFLNLFSYIFHLGSFSNKTAYWDSVVRHSGTDGYFHMCVHLLLFFCVCVT